MTDETLASGLTDQGSLTHDSLIAGEIPPVHKTVTLTSGQGELARGSVLGQVTADGKYTLSAAASEDGSETPSVVLAVDIDATSEVSASVIVRGDLNGNQLVYGAGITNADAYDALRSVGIYIIDVEAA